MASFGPYDSQSGYGLGLGSALGGGLSDLQNRMEQQRAEGQYAYYKMMAMMGMGSAPPPGQPRPEKKPARAIEELQAEVDDWLKDVA